MSSPKANPQNTADLADPTQPAGRSAPQTMTELANPPTTPLQEAAAAAMRSGLSGELVEIVLAQGEGKAGQEAQYVQVNTHTWLVPRNTRQILPVEAYEALTNTLPPQSADAAQAFYSPRFSVSVLARHAAPLSALQAA